MATAMESVTKIPLPEGKAWKNLELHYRRISGLHVLAHPIIQELEGDPEPKLEHDNSTNILIEYYRSLKEKV